MRGGVRRGNGSRLARTDTAGRAVAGRPPPGRGWGQPPPSPTDDTRPTCDRSVPTLQRGRVNRRAVPSIPDTAGTAEPVRRGGACPDGAAGCRAMTTVYRSRHGPVDASRAAASRRRRRGVGCRARPRRVGDGPPLAAALQHIQRARHGLRPRAHRARGALRRPAGRVVHSRVRGAGRAATPRSSRDLQRVVDRAATSVPSGRATSLLVAGPARRLRRRRLDAHAVRGEGEERRCCAPSGSRAGVEHAYVTGAASIQRELDPIFNDDLKKGESIAIPIALLVLLLVFGLSASVTIPFIFAACTITGTLGLMYGVVHLAETPTYVTNLVQLIGLGIAVDYSLLIVYRFREELALTDDKDAAVVRTMETAGRSVIFSGVAVALGLALLVAMPLPFMRMMGIAGFLIPIVSIAAAATLQPALLSLYGRRGVGAQADPARGAARPRAGVLGAARARDHGAAGRVPRPRRNRARRGGGARVRAAADARLDLRHPAHAPGGARLRRAAGRRRARRGRAVDRCSSPHRRERCWRRGSRPRSGASRRSCARTPRSRRSPRRRRAATSTRRGRTGRC